MDIKDITKDSGEVEIRGWVHDMRDLGGIKFIQLRDSTGMIQVTVVTDDADENVLENTKNLPNESVISVKGTVKENPKSKSGLEVVPESVELIVRSEPELPISVAEKKITTGQSLRLDWRCLDLRKLKHQAIFKVQSALLQGMTEYLLKEDYTQVFTPCIMGVASESGSEVFPIIYFNKEAFLRQDPQLHRQLTLAGGFDKIFDIGPAWRAEQSHTQNHLCEHRVVAIEKAFIKDETDTMRIEEQLVIAALKKVKEKCARELELLGVEVTVPKAPFPVLQFPDIYDTLKKMGKDLPKGEDLDRESENLLWKHVQKEYGCEFFFINRFPSAVKPFYVMRNDKEPEYANSVDLMFKGLELSSGGQREHRYEKIMENVRQTGMNMSEVEWFTKHFRYGVPPHGGFALGVERITKVLLGIENIRDCVLFPRDPERLVP